MSASIFSQSTELPFKKGIDMLTFFESWQAGNLPDLNKYDETDFAMLKSMGVDVIRLPIHFENLMEPAYTGKVMDIVFEKLDEVCDWAEKYQIYLVIDDHSFNSIDEDRNPPSLKLYKEHLEAVWPQI
ncbi:MAG: cellulase family glycosylhydrolase, partial [Spirochaetaceae bacterium]|nr:cellulase family glycosylhydrolase [Spirochaetaceae bacterium]